MRPVEGIVGPITNNDSANDVMNREVDAAPNVLFTTLLALEEKSYTVPGSNVADAGSFSNCITVVSNVVLETVDIGAHAPVRDMTGGWIIEVAF